MLPLFETPEAENKRALAATLAGLAREKVFIGTSSWKYEGWLGDLYTPERYFTRGRFSQRRFEDECLAEYAEVFPVVCGDFSFYQFPTPEFWKRLFSTAPPSLRFAFKVPEEITVKLWPGHARYGPRAGLENQNFLDASLFAANFASLLEPWASRIAALIFEFSPFAPRAMAGPEAFTPLLDGFLARLPQTFRYAVEIRNPDFLTPEYLTMLGHHRVAHVFNAWARMPELGAQIRLPGAFTTDFTVTRALLRQGRAYEEAVQAFAPYRAVQDPNPAGRDALKRLIERARMEGQPAYVFVNNRFEGNAPGTIRAITA